VSTFAKVFRLNCIAMKLLDNYFFVTTPHTICKINSKGEISTIAGSERGSWDGVGTSALL